MKNYETIIKNLEETKAFIETFHWYGTEYTRLLETNGKEMSHEKQVKVLDDIVRYKKWEKEETKEYNKLLREKAFYECGKSLKNLFKAFMGEEA